MQKTYAAIFFIILLLNMPPFNQLGKLPFMIQHYKTHKQQDPGLTLGGFIRLHYTGCDALAPDRNEHKQLPFKHMEQGAPIVSVAPVYAYSFHLPPVTDCRIQLSRYQEPGIPNPVLQNIFRPPQPAFL
jgi:hypothetical protein